MQESARLRFLAPTPLLEEEGNAGIPALNPDGVHPVLAHWPRAVAAFTAYNDPVNPVQIEFSKIFKKGLNGKESYACSGHLKMLHAW
jgi:hypothetical protein